MARSLALYRVESARPAGCVKVVHSRQAHNDICSLISPDSGISQILSTTIVKDNNREVPWVPTDIVQFRDLLFLLQAYQPLWYIDYQVKTPYLLLKINLKYTLHVPCTVEDALQLRLH